MVGEWQRVRLGDVCEFRSGSVFPTKYQGRIVGDYPFIKVSDIELPSNWKHIVEANNWINDDLRQEIKAIVHPPGAVVFAKIGVALTFNRKRILTRPTIIDNNMMSAIPRNGELDSLFLYYLLCQLDFNEIASGTALPYLNLSELTNIEVRVPPLPEQRAIAHILGTLDDKIELNRRMSETLEAMARAIFKAWFVDFEPVRAKMEGRWRRGESLPGLPAHLYDLFPDRLVDSGLGEIPEGWSIAALDTFAALVTTSVSPWKSPETVFEHYSIPAYDAGRMPAMEFGASIKSNKYRVDANSILISKLNPQTPRIWLPAVATAHAICSTEFMQFVPYDRGNRAYLYCLMSSEAIKSEVLKHVTGSTGSRQRAQPSQIMKVDFLHPHKDILTAFNHRAAPILNAVAENQHESRTLAALRDALLPKLISGELRIKDAERFLKERGL